MRHVNYLKLCGFGAQSLGMEMCGCVSRFDAGHGGKKRVELDKRSAQLKCLLLFQLHNSLRASGKPGKQVDFVILDVGQTRLE